MVGTTFVYDSATISNGTAQPIDELRVTIFAVDGDLVVTQQCFADLHCSYLIYRQFIISEFGYYGQDPEQSADMIAQMRRSETAIDVEVFNWQGAIVPFSNGQVASWSEEWSSPGFNEVYNMTLEQSCCVTSMSPAVSGEDLSSLTYQFTALGGSGDGEFLMIYDEGLGWWAEQTSTTINDGVVVRIQKQVLREVIAP